MENPFSGGPFGGSPLEDGDGQVTPCCPKCKSQNFRAWNTQYGLMRQCLEAGCKNEWSGGTMSAGRPNFAQAFPQPMPGTPAPDDDIPTVQYTGAGFRDPGKSFGDDDY